jgi:uncharacterized protein
MKKFSGHIKAILDSYVYMYMDPSNNEIFYVGKGKNNRAFSHLSDKKESEKVNRIAQIRKLNLEPKIEILVHGLNNETAQRVESAVIDLLGKDNLTNSIVGWKSGIYGRMTLDQVSQLFDKKRVAHITEPAILISVKKSYRYGMTPIELYDATRSSWRVGKITRDTKKVKYAFSLYDYVIQEVYEIKSWFDAGSTLSTRENLFKNNLFEFVGKIAKPSIRNKYLFKVIEGIRIPQQGFKPLNITR